MKQPFLTAIALLGVLAFSPIAAVADPPDSDCDTVKDSSDNCPEKFNPGQGNLDLDADGDACDSDKDGDGVENAADNCPRHANGAQEDADADGAGDACDQCADSPEPDSVNGRGCTVDQICPCSGPELDRAWKNTDQYMRCIKRKSRSFRRNRTISREEASEIRQWARASGCGTLTPQEGDNDGDTVADEDDNCVSDSNPSQSNTDGDALGNACDSDKDNDGVLNRHDNCPVLANADGQDDDGDGDGVGDACDECEGSGLADRVDRTGCSIDQLCLCDEDDDGNPWKGHGKYTRCVSDEVSRMRLARNLTREEADAIRAAAVASSCGERPLVCQE